MTTPASTGSADHRPTQQASHADCTRVPVIGDDGEILYILSQSRLVKFLSKHIAEFDFGTLSIKQTNLGVQYEALC